MSRLSLVGGVLFLALAGGCSNAVRVGPPPDAGFDADEGDGDGGVWDDGGAWWPEADPPDVGPACPDAGGTVEDRRCDLIEQDCDPGLACYGWVEYTEDPCQREIYHTSCLTPGYGGQGDPCDAWCLPGFECFVTGDGTQCLRLCDIVGGRRTCPAGQICEATDFPEVGACH